VEPVITIAAAARLHFDYGWPQDCIGTQSKKWEFDLFTVRPEKNDIEYLAAEVKKSEKELDAMITIMALYCDGKGSIASIPPAHLNAYKKCLGLLRCRAPLFWAVGPGKRTRIFKVSYSDDCIVSFVETGEHQLLRFGRSRASCA
jgi:hypothetical protein